MTPSRPRVLVTGATGYIGGRLVPGLLEAGYAVRCLARSARKLAARRWASDPNVEMLEADLDDVESTAAAARGCGPAYYLVHSMVSTGSRLCRNRPENGPDLRPGRRAGRDLPHHLSGRARRDRRRPERASLLAPRGGGDAGVGRRARHGLPCGDGHRRGFRVVRDPALPGRAAARDGHAEVGDDGISADCDRQRARLPGRLPPGARDRGPDARHRRARHRQLPDADADHGGRARPAEAAGDSRPRAHASSQLALDPSRDAAEPSDRPAACRGPPQPGRLPQRRRGTADAAAAARRPRGDPPRAPPGRPARGGDGVVGRRAHRRRP